MAVSLQGERDVILLLRDFRATGVAWFIALLRHQHISDLDGEAFRLESDGALIG